MRCPRCQALNVKDRLFCRLCGLPLGQRCPICDFLNGPGDLYCGGCGEEVAPLDLGDTVGEPLEPHEVWESAEAERRQITVMFCDLVGSTALSERLDPEDMRDLLKAYREACNEVVHRYKGWIAQFQGDGILIYFGYPEAHEDDATRALRAALEIIPAVRRIQNKWCAADQLDLDVRIGIDTGLVVVGDLPSGNIDEFMAAVGDALNVAARVQSYAEPGAVLATGHTMRLVEGLFITEDVGRHLLRGVTEPVHLFRVRQVSESLTRFEAAAELTAFVNRESELALILDRWAWARSGRGQVVLISGEPGIGKSRLVQVVQEQIADQPHGWVRCQCSPYFGQSALYPVIVGLQRIAGLRPEDAPEEKLTKLERFLEDISAVVDEMVPLLAALLGIPISDRYRPLELTPERQKELTLLAIMQLCKFMASRRPLVLLIEDVHWIDPTSSELLERLIARVPEGTILLLVTFRPEYTRPASESQSVVHLALGRLEQSTTAALIGRVAHGKPLPVDLQAQLVARSEGIPLFVEELTKAVLESGFVQEQNDRFLLMSPLPSSGIPATLQDSLLARLDRLGPIKDVAQFASAIGRDFTYKLLAEITALTRDQLLAALERLTAAGMISKLPGIVPETYSFKHALVRDAAYDSMLRSRRAQLHGRIANALRTHFAPEIERSPELLALHLTNAGLSDQAIEGWLNAGLRAIERSATLEAESHLRTGLTLLATLPATQERTKQEVRLQTALGAALRGTQGFAAPVVVEVFDRAKVLCADLKDEQLLLDVLPGLQSYYHVHGHLVTARELGEQLVELTRARSEEPYRLLDARRRLGWSLFWLGELAQAGEHLEGALALYDPKDHQLHIRLYGDHPGVFAYCNLAWVRWAQGRTVEADRHSRAALKLAEEVDHVLSLTYSTCVIGALYAARWDPIAAQKLAARAIPLAEDKGYPYWTAWAHIIHGWALTRLGVPDQGISELSRGIDAYAATGGELVRPYALALLAEARSSVGQNEQAIVILDEALQRARNKEIHFYEPELLRLKGCALLAAGAGLPESETCLRQAAESAAGQGAYFFELRSVISLARTYVAAGRHSEALALLADVRSRCPNQQITPELRAADQLLAELGP
jgi:class 3 adenylate cyclase/tetratricopeptide (TPR) repeat protein/ABC-type transport system involved in cytochrome c biogenesis ATPase subunit